jgi:hypothetical protein
MDAEAAMATQGKLRKNKSGMKPPKAGTTPASTEELGRLEADGEYRTLLPDGRELILVRKGTELRCRFSGPESEGTEDTGVTILDSLEPLTVRPILPERPLVLQPETELRLIPGAVITTSVPLPLSLSLEFDRPGRPQPVREFPTVQLSKTWFGEPDSGESAYSWKTTLDERPLPEETDPWIAVCPLVVRNESPENLEFKRMILRVPQLSLFSAGNRLVTNTVTIRFRGQTQVSQVAFAKRPKGVQEPLTKLSEPRMPADKTLLRRSFAIIKTISAG